MIETQAQRTLVKSPPELWAEVSDPSALARHLAEITTEIRITRIEPERSVAWEGDRASGRVDLAPSGWGTKVMLTLQTGAPATVAAELTRRASGGDAGRAEAGTPEAPRPGPAGRDAPAHAPLDETGAADKPATGLAEPGTPEAPGRGPAAPDAPAHAPPDKTGPADEPETGVATQPTLITGRAAQETDVKVTIATAKPLKAEATPRSGWWARLVARLSGGQTAQPPAPHELDTSGSDEAADTEAPMLIAPDPDLQAGVGRPRPSVPPGAPAPGAVSSPIPGSHGPAPGPPHGPRASGPGDAEPASAPAEQGASEAPERELQLQPPSSNCGEVDRAQASAALAAMLDSLGSAHHRPFSRS